MSQEEATSLSVLIDIRDEMRTSNERGKEIVEYWRAQEERSVVSHAELMDFYARRRELDALDIAALKRNAERDTRWQKLESLKGKLTEAAGELSEAIDKKPEDPK